MDVLLLLVELSVPSGTISTPSVREVCFAGEVTVGVSGTLNFTLCDGTILHYAVRHSFMQGIVGLSMMCYKIRKLRR